jgi:hypothetical protein
LYRKKPKGANSVISLRQRHYPNRTKPVLDAHTVINIATLHGIDGSKKNEIWWSLLEDIARTRSLYNYQLEVAYDMQYTLVPDLEKPTATGMMLKCFSNLKPMYDFLSNS